MNPPRLPRSLVLPLLVALLALSAPPSARAEARGHARATFHRRAVATGLNFPLTFTFSKAGRIYYGEKSSGEIHLLDPDSHDDRVFFTIPKVVDAGEQGLLGLALDPDFPSQPFVYAYATRDLDGTPYDQILRIRYANGHGKDPHVIFSSKTRSGAYHDGGRILFGPDGFLYAVQGDGHSSKLAQDKSNTAGKVIRMTRGGKPAPGNPFGQSRIWSYGHRNSFGMAFDPVTGRLWETENGPDCNDELNRIVKGGNFGWGPKETCDGQAPQNTNNSGPTPRILPKRFYTPTIAPTGTVFCHGCRLGSASKDRLFFGAFNTSQIRRVTLTSNRLGVASQEVVFTNDHGILSMERGTKGGIYFSDSGGIFRLVLA